MQLSQPAELLADLTQSGGHMFEMRDPEWIRRLLGPENANPKLAHPPMLHVWHANCGDDDSDGDTADAPVGPWTTVLDYWPTTCPAPHE